MFKLIFNIMDISSYSPSKKLILTIANIFTVLICLLINYWIQSFSGALIMLKYIILLVLFLTISVAIVKQVICFIFTIKDLFKREYLPVILVNFIFSSLFILLIVFQARQLIMW